MNFIETWRLIITHPVQLGNNPANQNPAILLNIMYLPLIIVALYMIYSFISEYILYTKVKTKFKHRSNIHPNEINNRYVCHSNFGWYDIRHSMLTTIAYGGGLYLFASLIGIIITIILFVVYLILSTIIYHLYGETHSLLGLLKLLPVATMLLAIGLSIKRHKPQWLRLIILLTIILSMIAIIFEIII